VLVLIVTFALTVFVDLSVAVQVGVVASSVVGYALRKKISGTAGQCRASVTSASPRLNVHRSAICIGHDALLFVFPRSATTPESASSVSDAKLSRVP
jgi:MFS superfamily sulfate permease-like transporter